MFPVLRRVFLVAMAAIALASCGGGGGSGSGGGDSDPTPPVNQPPVPAYTFTMQSQVAPATVDFDASDSSDPDGSITGYEWDFDDGSTGSGVTVSHTFNDHGCYDTRLTVTDNDGLSRSTSEEICLEENTPPHIANLSQMSIDLVESPHASSERDICADLTDDNEEHRPVSLVEATTLSPNVSLSSPIQQDGQWCITASADDQVTHTQDYTVNFRLRSQNGDEVTVSKDGTLENLLEVSGNLEDNEADIGLDFGEIRAYDPQTGERYLEGLEVDTFVSSTGGGNFTVVFREPIIPGSVAMLQFAGLEGNDKTTYVRTIEFSQDHIGLTVRAIPMPSYQGMDVNGDWGSNNYDDWDSAAHVNAANIPIRRWNIDELNNPLEDRLPKVQITRDNPCGKNYTFPDNEIDAIKDAIIELNMVRAFIEDRELSVEVFPDDLGSVERFSTEDCVDGRLTTSHDGYVIVSPDDVSSLGASGVASTSTNSDGHITSGRIRKTPLDPPRDEVPRGYKLVIAHEFGHTFGLSHPDVLPVFKTRMNSTGTAAGMVTDVDFKTGQIVHEASYKPREGFVNISSEWFNSFLEISFYDEDVSLPPLNRPFGVFIGAGPGKNPRIAHFYAPYNHNPDIMITSYEWDFGDGSTASGASIANIFDPGCYTILLTMVDNTGANNQISRSLCFD